MKFDEFWKEKYPFDGTGDLAEAIKYKAEQAWNAALGEAIKVFNEKCYDSDDVEIAKAIEALKEK